MRARGGDDREAEEKSGERNASRRRFHFELLEIESDDGLTTELAVENAVSEKGRASSLGGKIRSVGSAAGNFVFAGMSWRCEWLVEPSHSDPRLYASTASQLFESCGGTKPRTFYHTA